MCDTLLEHSLTNNLTLFIGEVHTVCQSVTTTTKKKRTSKNEEKEDVYDYERIPEVVLVEHSSTFFTVHAIILIHVITLLMKSLIPSLVT